MRILVILSRIPYPLEKGDKLRAFHLLRCLHQHHELILCCLTDSDVSPSVFEKLKEISAHVYIFRLKPWKIYWNLVRGVFSTKPFQVHYFYQKQIQNQLDRVIEKHVPKHIFCQLIRVTEYVKNYAHLPKTLDYMDSFSMGMKRRLNHTPWIIKPLVWLEAKRLEKYEREIFIDFDHKLIISERDRLSIQHPHKQDIKIITNGIDTDYFDIYKIPRTPKKYDLVFTGNMSYLPNIEAVIFIVNHIMPGLRKYFPQAKLLICGANPNARVRAFASPFVTVTGWVDDIRTAYAESRIFVAPLFLGSGLQNKLLEAMRMGLPCVTTPYANEGLKAQQGRDVLLAQTSEEFVKHILTLLQEKELYNALSNSAYQFVTENFSWEKSGEDLNKLIS